MTVAERQRAAAEAAFSEIAPGWTPQPVVKTKVPQHRGGPPQFHQSEFQVRFNEQDSLATQIRLADSKKEALAAARELHERFGLPPDLSLLVKVLGLKDNKLILAALEEMLDLDDRGRVRSSPQLIATLESLPSRNRDIRELKELFLTKLGAL